MKFLEPFQSQILAFVRILAGYAFLLHGTAKFFEFPLSMTDGNGAVPLFSLFGVAGVLEIVGGALIVLGLFVRPTAFILSGQMAVAYLMFHFSVFPMANEGKSPNPRLSAWRVLAKTIWENGKAGLSTGRS